LGSFGLKINHLATLGMNQTPSFKFCLQFFFERKINAESALADATDTGSSSHTYIHTWQLVFEFFVSDLLKTLPVWFPHNQTDDISNKNNGRKFVGLPLKYFMKKITRIRGFEQVCMHILHSMSWANQDPVTEECQLSCFVCAGAKPTIVT
jgi:hypothetical protein